MLLSKATYKMWQGPVSAAIMRFFYLSIYLFIYLLYLYKFDTSSFHGVWAVAGLEIKTAVCVLLSKTGLIPRKGRIVVAGWRSAFYLFFSVMLKWRLGKRWGRRKLMFWSVVFFSISADRAAPPLRNSPNDSTLYHLFLSSNCIIPVSL